MLFGTLGLILGFSGLIFIHEFGHFILAKWNGVRVHVFSLGMGPYLISFTWRETVYALSLIPLGGYVKLAGQDDFNPNLKPNQDSRDYRNKRPGRKVTILAAGAIFNLLFTIVAFTICYWVGMEIEPARIGLIMPSKPLAEAVLEKDGSPAHLQEGDRIIAVNGVPVKSFFETMLQVAGLPRGKDLQLHIERHGGLFDTAYVKVKTQPDKKIGAPSIGLNAYSFEMALPLGFKTRNIIAVREDPRENKKLEDLPAAKSGAFKKGDEIVSIGDRPIEKLADMLTAAPRSQGKPQKFILRRLGQENPIEVTLAAEKNEDGDYVFGILLEVVSQVTMIEDDAEAYKKGLRKDCYILGFQPEEEWEGNNPYTLVWKRGKLYFSQNRNAQTADVTTIDLTVPPPGSTQYVFMQERMSVEKYKCKGGISEALSVAWNDTLRFSGSVFTVLRSLFTGDVDKSAISGVVGIGHAVYKVASTQTLIKFLWFLAFLSLNLGVLQLIPIPLLDGWHILMVLIEKLKGSPVAPKVQEAFQYVGFFIIGALLVLSFYNDLFRIFVK
ncbi:MAG: site-2 protease family protein [Planctomycetota bacterium]